MNRYSPTRCAVLVCICLALGAALLAPEARVQAQTDPNVTVDPKLFQDLRWRNVGPHRGGRVTAVAGVRTQPNVFYMGATGGGVWKSVNYGITWEPIADNYLDTGSIGAIDVSDSNPSIVYVGTGSSAIRSNVILGRGMWKSTDAGRTWAFIGLKDTGQIGTVRVHPKNPDIVYVAALGNPFDTGPERGVYRTKDGGRTWQKVLFINDRTGTVSLVINWSNPDEIYAGAWRGERKPWTIISGGPASEGGVYKSTDGGDTWKRSSNGFPTNLVGKVWVDVAQSKPNVVYALIEAPGPEGGLYRSDDSGANWKLVNREQRLRARPFYFNYVYANPKNENEVWVNELNLHKSVDGGKTWTVIPTPHSDNQGMWFNPDNPNIIVQSNDGGANVTQDGGRSWSTIMNQPTGEFYMVDTDQRFPYRIYGPQQDNSTVVLSSVPAFSWSIDDPTQTWGQASGCESGQIRPTPDGKIVYGDCKGEFGRYHVDTGQEQHFWINPQQRYGKNPKEQKFRFVRQSPIEVSPHNPRVVYHGSQFLHRTIDGGVTWTKISPDLTANEPDKQVDSGEPITRDMTGEEVYSALYAIRASRLEPGVIWTGSNDGPVSVTRDDGKTWKNVTPKMPPGGRVHTIEDSPHRKGSAYVSVYRLYLGDFKPYLYMTNDYGETWTLLTDGSNGIPADHPMHVVREDPVKEGLLYAGTWYSMFVSFDQGKHWQVFRQNLPSTPVTDIKVHDNDVVISTMGRAFWIMDNVEPLRQVAAGIFKTTSRPAAPATAKPAVAPFDFSAKMFLYQAGTTYRERYVPMGGRWDMPEYPMIGARIDYNLQSAPAGEVTLEIMDAAGKIVRTFSSEGQAGPARGRRGGMTTMPKKVGMNRFVWDLRFPGPWSPAAPQGEGAGPMVAPGTYKARLTVDGQSKTESLVVRADPRVLQDNVTNADLTALMTFSLKVRDALSEARQLAERIRLARERKAADDSVLRALYDRLVNKPGVYTDNMLISQIDNISRMVGQADQKVPASAIEQFGVVTKELAAVKADIEKAIPASQ